MVEGVMVNGTTAKASFKMYLILKLHTTLPGLWKFQSTNIEINIQMLLIYKCVVNQHNDFIYHNATLSNKLTTVPIFCFYTFLKDL